MFEQHERWLEELREHTGRKELIACRSDHMPLTAIAAELTNACGDPQMHDKKKIRDWESLEADLADTLDWIGPELSALVDGLGRAICQTIANDLLAPGPNGGARIDDTKRPIVGAAAEALTAVFGGEDLLVAAWRDLVTACRTVDHTVYPYGRIRFLRDTLFDLSEHRKQGLGFGSPVQTAVDALFGDTSNVRYAQAMVGDPIDMTTPYDPRGKTDLTDDDLADLADRCLVTRSLVGEYVVWFRIAPAYIPAVDCVTHGDATFFDAQVLAGALTDHERARQLDVVPEELLTDEIRELQLTGNVDDYTGFQFEAQLVYARVAVRNVERHLAVDTARMYLDTLLAVVGVSDGMWTVLGGHLFFAAGEPPYPPVPRWASKVPRPELTFYQNDFFTTHLSEINAEGHVITAARAIQLREVLRLREALNKAPHTDPEAVVMAAVRAIEHCNTWAAPTGGLNWYKFAIDYLSDGGTLDTCGNRVASDVFAAVEQYLPEPRPDPEIVRELDSIRKDITVRAGYGEHTAKLKTPAHVSALKDIYAGHWLARQLAETEDFLTSTATLGATLDLEKTRFDSKVARLRRTRNAAIHGGVLSETACATIADFAAYLARQALSATIWAIVTGNPVDIDAASRRDECRERIRRLKQGGDLANLFKLA
ncbi:hypothetical protein DE4585_04769 [Mycobacteroides salmoniphilum]|uniref:Apea-like HEPN domain-containing protein n=1 Tax=Mycobacteroides salmoniphilum TaxID=404941 RepID=A0A4R8RTK5_9MYCO|nr:hypothetical protein [Mycobacteroides salmoniphilum]TDZ77375.1 hypothetical protein DE4585_04769 [Mycobacteroides salmoniphilum]